MANDEEIEIEECECGEPWCDRCAYQREMAVEANPCTACNGSGLAPPKDECLDYHRGGMLFTYDVRGG